MFSSNARFDWLANEAVENALKAVEIDLSVHVDVGIVGKKVPCAFHFEFTFGVHLDYKARPLRLNGQSLVTALKGLMEAI